MKVLVVGSKRHMDATAEQAEEDARRFEKACRQIGKRLAEKGHSLIVGTDDRLDADYFFVEGANEVAGKHQVVVSRPEEDARPTPYNAERETKFKNISFRFTSRKGEWTAALVHALSLADVLLLIGGRTAALATGYSAEALRKPVLAIPSFGGAAQAVWQEVRRYYRECGIKEHEEGALREDWNADTAEIAVRSAESLVKNTPFRSKGNLVEIGMMIATLTLITVWVALFRRPWGIDKDIAFYSMLTIAAMLGTTLRSALRLVRDEIVDLNARMLLIEARAGILIAFGFAILYLAGGIVITGAVVSLTTDQDFMRVAITMSILGFASALLLHEAAANLQDRLMETLKGRRATGS
jgi:hypothetical protein